MLTHFVGVGISEQKALTSKLEPKIKFRMCYIAEDPPDIFVTKVNSYGLENS
jgi:hypothetical protein